MAAWPYSVEEEIKKARKKGVTSIVVLPYPPIGMYPHGS